MNFLPGLTFTVDDGNIDVVLFGGEYSLLSRDIVLLKKLEELMLELAGVDEDGVVEDSAAATAALIDEDNDDRMDPEDGLEPNPGL